MCKEVVIALAISVTHGVLVATAIAQTANFDRVIDGVPG